MKIKNILSFERNEIEEVKNSKLKFRLNENLFFFLIVNFLDEMSFQMRIFTNFYVILLIKNCEKGEFLFKTSFFNEYYKFCEFLRLVLNFTILKEAKIFKLLLSNIKLYLTQSTVTKWFQIIIIQ